MAMARPRRFKIKESESKQFALTLIQDTEDYEKYTSSILCKKYICTHKGYGVFTRKKIKKNQLLGIYRGLVKKIPKVDEYSFEVCNGPSYRFYLSSGYYIDGDPSDIISTVNDSHNRFNAKMSSLNKTVIGLFAINDIEENVEITYSYTDGIYGMPWRKKQPLSYQISNYNKLECCSVSSQYCTYCQDEMVVAALSDICDKANNSSDVEKTPPILTNSCENLDQSLNSNTFANNSSDVEKTPPILTNSCENLDQSLNSNTFANNSSDVEKTPPILTNSCENLDQSLNSNTFANNSSDVEKTPPILTNSCENLDQSLNSNTFDDNMDVQLDSDDSVIDKDYVPNDSEINEDSLSNQSDSSSSNIRLDECREIISTDPSNFRSKSERKRFFKLQKTQRDSQEIQMPLPDARETGSKTDSKKYVRKQRPCPFCLKLVSKFSEHLNNMHIDKTQVSEAKNEPATKKRKALYHILMKEGIKRYNSELKGSQEPMHMKQQLRKSKFKFQCSQCLMYYSKRGSSNHKNKCAAKKTILPRGIGVNKSLIHNRNISTSDFMHPDYENKVLNPMRLGPIKAEIEKDIELLYLGNFTYEIFLARRSIEGQAERRSQRILSTISRLKITFNNLPSRRAKEMLKLSEILDNHQWLTVKQVIKKMTYKSEGDKQIFKRGVANSLKFDISTAIDALTSMYTCLPGLTSEEIKKRLKDFQKFYKASRDSAFGSLAYAGIESRAENRTNAKLPLEKDINKVVNSCISLIKNSTSFEMFDEVSFVKLRRAIVTRLIFFNGKRPSEIANLKVHQWELCKKECYLTPQQKLLLQNSDSASTLDNFKVIITIGKRADVPVIIPKGLFKALDIICDPEQRKSAGVHPLNGYIFPSCRLSMKPCNGTESVESFIKECVPELTNTLTSVKVRHLLATKFALEDFSKESRNTVFKFFGHSESINELNYQAPNTARVLKLMAPALQKIDKEYGYEVTKELQDTNTVVPTTPTTKRPLASASFMSPKSPHVNATNTEELSDSDDCSSPENKKPRRNCWRKEDTSAISSTFHRFIIGEEKYPKQEEIKNFFKENPHILEDHELKEKLNKFRIKLNNTKKLFKESHTNGKRKLF